MQELLYYNCMSTQTIIFLVFGSVVLVLVITSVILFIYSYRANRKIDELLEKGKIKEFKDVFLKQKERNDDLEEKIKDAFAKIRNLENISKITVQKTGIVRFNPFNAMGGNQSFVIALLDAKDNGFVISSLFVNEGNRVYAKEIKKGKSDHSLSNEEKLAIESAINSN